MGKPSKRAILKAIKNSDAVISTIADRLGVAWATARTYIDSDPELLQALEDENNIVLDVAEKELFKEVRAGEMWAIKYTLSTKGTKRGWIESQRREHVGDKGGPIKHQINPEQMSDDDLAAALALQEKYKANDPDSAS